MVTWTASTPPSRIWRKTFSDQFAYCSPSMTMVASLAARRRRCKKENGPRIAQGPLFSISVSVALFADGPEADALGQPVDGEDDDQNVEDHEEHLVVKLRAEALDQDHADAARANDAEDRGRARVAFPEIEALGDEHRQHLRQVAVADHREGTGPGCAHALHLLAVDVLDRLGIELGQRAEIRDEDREHTGQRPEPHGADEDEAPDQLVDAAQDVEEPPHHLPHDADRHDILCREKAHEERSDGSQERS